MVWFQILKKKKFNKRKPSLRYLSFRLPLDQPSAVSSLKPIRVNESQPLCVNQIDCCCHTSKSIPYVSVHDLYDPQPGSPPAHIKQQLSNESFQGLSRSLAPDLDS